MDEKLCSERHKALDKEVLRHSEWLNNHERKLDKLERSDASNTTQIQNLTKAIGSQTKAIWGLVVSILVLLVGFILGKI